MRTLALLLAIISSGVLARAEEKIEVGEWVEFKGTFTGSSSTMGGWTKPITVKYAIVGEEKDDAGNRLFWLEVNTDFPAPILAKALIPAQAFEEMVLSSPNMVKQVKRWIVKMGDQPAMEFPVEESLKQIQEIIGILDPEAKITEFGEEEVETAKGTFKCQKKQYLGKMSMEQAEGPMVLTANVTYDGVFWHSDAVPIVGYAKAEFTVVAEVSSEVPIPGVTLPPSEKSHGQVELVEFGQGATSALTEDPVQKPVPKPEP